MTAQNMFASASSAQRNVNNRSTATAYLYGSRSQITAINNVKRKVSSNQQISSRSHESFRRAAYSAREREQRGAGGEFIGNDDDNNRNKEDDGQQRRRPAYQKSTFAAAQESTTSSVGAGDIFVREIGKKLQASSSSSLVDIDSNSNNYDNNNKEKTNKTWQYLTCTGETMDDEDENERPWENNNNEIKAEFEENAAGEEKNNSKNSNKTNKTTNVVEKEISEILMQLKRLGEKRKFSELLQYLDTKASFVSSVKNDKKVYLKVLATASVAAAAKCSRDLTFATTILKAAEGPFSCGVSPAAYSAIIIEAGRANELDLAFEMLEWWKKGRGPKSTQFGASANKNGKMFIPNSFLWTVDDVPKGLNRSDRVGVKWHPRRTATSLMLFSILDACAECGDVPRAIETKNEIFACEGRVKRSDDFERAWCSILKAHTRSSEPLKALSAFEEMLKTNEIETKKSLLAHNILMSACVKGGRPDWSIDILEKAKDHGLKPDATSYATCASGETQAARGILGTDYACDVETLKRLFQEYTNIEKRNKIAYGAFVSAFLRKGEANYAINVLEHAQRDGPKRGKWNKNKTHAVSPNSYFLVMRHAANEGDVESVRKLSEMLRNHPKDTALLRAESALYESEALAAANDVEGARDAIFRAQNVADETEAAKVLREATEKVLVALFVENEMSVEDVSPNNVPKARNVARALSLLDGAWSFDEFDEVTGKGQFPKPPPKEGYEKAIEVGNVSPLAFKAGLNPNDSIQEAIASDALRLYSCEELVQRKLLARRMDSARMVLEQANKDKKENSSSLKDLLVLDGFGEPIGVLRRGLEIDEENKEFASAETLMDCTTLVSCFLKTSIGDVALQCFSSENSIPIAICDDVSNALIGAIFREDLFESKKNNNKMKKKSLATTAQQQSESTIITIKSDPR